MKRKTYKFISIIMTFSIVIISCMSLSMNVYAVYDPDTPWYEKAITEVGGLAHYLGSQIGALFSDDFIQFYKNKDDFEYWWNTGNIKYNEDTQEIIFDADLVEQFKQALIDYNNEMSEYWIVPTETYSSLDVTKFEHKVTYNTARNLIRGNDMLFTNGNSGTIYAATSNYFKNGYVFICAGSSYDISSFPTNLMSVYMYDSNWNKKSTEKPLEFSFLDNSSGKEEWIETPYTSMSQGKEQSFVPQFQTFYINYSSVNSGKMWSNYTSSTFNSTAQLFTSDGCRVRVFKSLNSYKLYSVNQRAVYFGTDFYTAEPHDLTASLDDLADSTDRMNDTLNRLLDKIDDNTDEKTIEELLQQILDEMKNQGSGGSGGQGGGETGGGSGGGSWSGDMTDGLFGYLDAILTYLDRILANIEDLVFLEWSGQEDGLDDLSGLISGIKDDPETGSQSAADTLAASFSDVARGITKKFPFSIPWDLYALFNALSGSGAPAFSSADVDLLLDNGVSPVSLDPAVSVIDSDTGGGTPVFSVPVAVESIGYEGEIVLDLEEFEGISIFSRALFSILFCVVLLKLTIRIAGLLKFGGGGDD